MSVFSIDPGTQRSGWAYVLIDRTAQWGLVKTQSGHKGFDAADDQVQSLRGILEATPAEALVIEAYVPRSAKRGMMGNIALVGMIWNEGWWQGIPVHLVYAGAWKRKFKTNAAINEHYGDQLEGKELSQHELDALAIAAYYLEKNK